MLEMGDIMSDNNLLQHLQKHLPIVFNFVTDLKIIPKFMRPVFDEIVVKAEAPFTLEPHTRNKVTNNKDPLAFFPNLPRLYERGQYKIDKERTSQICTKESTGHPSLLPGIFTVFCQHGICYGFEVMESAESPNRPFTFLKTRFQRICYGFEVMESAESPNRPFTFLKTRFQSPPDVVIYGNACNLHSYCLNRDPGYFRNTLFVVDGLHWDNHTACAVGYKSLLYPLLKTVNTQIVEQNNSKLRKLKSSLSYMKLENFINFLGFFLWYCNRNCKNKNSANKC